MKLLPFPLIDDFDVLSKMKDNPKIGSQPYITHEYQLMFDQYNNYINYQGNPWACVGNNISSNLKDRLAKHYSSPYDELKYINIIREKGSPDVCPMCGSLKSGTVDHLLPKTDYPEWAIFSKNLVPACDCNVKRRSDVKGASFFQRVLHPYYDNCLNSRIVKLELSADLNNPDMKIIPISVSNISIMTIQYHINTVIIRSGIFDWLNEKWQVMRKRPRTVISGIPRGDTVITMTQLEEYLSDTLDCKDEEHGTPNNWYSILIYGIKQSSDAKNWLLNRHNGIITETIDPFG